MVLTPRPICKSIIADAMRAVSSHGIRRRQRHLKPLHLQLRIEASLIEKPCSLPSLDRIDTALIHAVYVPCARLLRQFVVSVRPIIKLHQNNFWRIAQEPSVVLEDAVFFLVQHPRVDTAKFSFLWGGIDTISSREELKTIQGGDQIQFPARRILPARRT
jgi:hypothetical protein